MVLRRFAEPPSDSRKGSRHRPQRRKGEQDERTSRFTSDRMVAILRQERQPRLSQPAWRTPEIAELRVYYGRHRIRVLLRRRWRVKHKRVCLGARTSADPGQEAFRGAFSLRSALLNRQPGRWIAWARIAAEVQDWSAPLAADHRSGVAELEFS